MDLSGKFLIVHFLVGRIKCRMFMISLDLETLFFVSNNEFELKEAILIKTTWDAFFPSIVYTGDKFKFPEWISLF